MLQLGATMAEAPNWAEQVTAIGTAVLALSVIGAFAAAVFAAQQVREARRIGQAQMAADFFRRWNEDSLVETRRLVAHYPTADELAVAFQRHVADNAPEAYIMYRELDFFEQFAALERSGAFDDDLVRRLFGRIIVERWALWQPALQAVHGDAPYPYFADLARRMGIPDDA